MATTDGGCGITAAECNADGLLTCFRGTFVVDAGPVCPLPPFIPLSCAD